MKRRAKRGDELAMKVVPVKVVNRNAEGNEGQSESESDIEIQDDSERGSALKKRVIARTLVMS